MIKTRWDCSNLIILWEKKSRFPSVGDKLVIGEEITERGVTSFFVHKCLSALHYRNGFPDVQETHSQTFSDVRFLGGKDARGLLLANVSTGGPCQ